MVVKRRSVALIGFTLPFSSKNCGRSTCRKRFRRKGSLVFLNEWNQVKLRARVTWSLKIKMPSISLRAFNSCSSMRSRRWMDPVSA
ncbi:hypothetical protein D9M68_985670 [compost metagenome]